MKKHILVVGSIAIDNTIFIQALPSAGTTTIADSYFQNIGGKGANQACAALFLGSEVSFSVIPIAAPAAHVVNDISPYLFIHAITPALSGCRREAPRWTCRACRLSACKSDRTWLILCSSRKGH